MHKKVFWLFVALAILWCSPLWANDDNPWNEYLFAFSDQQDKVGESPAASAATPQKNYWVVNPADQRDQTVTQNYWGAGSQVSAVNPKSSVFKTSPQPTRVTSPNKSFQFVSSAGKSSKPVVSSRAPLQLPKLGQPQVAGPQDICPFTAVCYNPTETQACVGGFPGGVLCSYQDPSVTCPPPACPAYPFEVDTIYIKLCNPDQVPCTVQVFPAILDSKDSLLPGGGICHVPGALLCTGPQQTIIIPPNTICQTYAFPLDQPCCVDSDYFACLDLLPISGHGTCNFGPCTDNSCSPCCDYWDGGIAGGAWDDLCVPGGPYGIGPLPGNLAIWTYGLHSCQNNCDGVQPDTNKNHYKTWGVTQMTLGVKRQVKDQFMTDSLFLQQLEFISNPVRKVVFNDLGNDTFHIADPDDHLTWYRATGRDTLLKVTYQNQFEATSVCIDSVRFLLVPAQKDGHPPFDSLDHYKAYRIQNPQLVNFPIELEDQFDRSMGTVENVTSFLPVFFLTPCQKNLEPTYDLTTHYVAYEIAPSTGYGGPTRQVTDQFLFQRTINVFNSRYLLVPTRKLNVEVCVVVPPDTNCPPATVLNFGITLDDFGNPHVSGDVITTEYVSTSNIVFGTGVDPICLAAYPSVTVANDAACPNNPRSSGTPLFTGHWWAQFYSGAGPGVKGSPMGVDTFCASIGFIDVVAKLYAYDSCCNVIDSAIAPAGGGSHQTLCVIDPLGQSRICLVEVRSSEDPAGLSMDCLFYDKPVNKGVCQPTQPVDTLRNHFKTWRVITPAKDTFALVQDQFTIYDPLKVDTIDFLSNPVRKVVFGATTNDTFNILRPDDHLTWYKAHGKVISVKVEYVNQFESTTVYIDSVKYLLLPTQKLSPFHNPPDSLLGHYTAYKVRKPKGFRTLLELKDQFDVIAPELIDSLVPRYFLTPAQKNNEPVFGPDTHYVALEIFPKRVFVTTSQTLDQFTPLGPRGMQIQKSELLLVPTEKIKFTICTHKPNDCNGDVTINLADIICDVNVVFKGRPKPVPNCRCDSNDDGVCTLPDIVYKVNYVFKGGPTPIPSKECCIAP